MTCPDVHHSRTSFCSFAGNVAGGFAGRFANDTCSEHSAMGKFAQACTESPHVQVGMQVQACARGDPHQAGQPATEAPALA